MKRNAIMIHFLLKTCKLLSVSNGSKQIFVPRPYGYVWLYGKAFRLHRRHKFEAALINLIFIRILVNQADSRKGGYKF